MHFGICTVHAHQFTVGSLLNNLPSLQNTDLIRVYNGGKPVGNHNDGFPSQQFVQSFLYPVFIFRISKCSCFIQQHHRGVFQDCAGKGDPLHFTTGKIDSICPDHRVRALRQLFQNIVTLCQMKGLENILT